MFDDDERESQDAKIWNWLVEEFGADEKSGTLRANISEYEEITALICYSNGYMLFSYQIWCDKTGYYISGEEYVKSLIDIKRMIRQFKSIINRQIIDIELEEKFAASR